MKCSIVLSKRRGSALVAVIIFGAIMSICAIFAYRSTLFQTRMAERSQDFLAAMAVAEAGAELAMVELNKDASAAPPAFTGWSGSTTRKYTEKIKDTNGQTIGEAEVQVSSLDAEPKIVATGYVPTKSNSRLRRTIQLAAKNDTVPSPFGGFGIYAFDKIDLQGNANAVGNTGSGGSMKLQGNAKIIGNAQAKGAIDLQGNAKVTKKSEANSAPTAPPAPPVPEFDTTLPDFNTNNNIIVYDSKGKKVNVPTAGSSKNALGAGNYDMSMPAPATYHLNKFSLSGNSNLNITGSGTVNLFVENDFSMSGNGKINVPDGVTVNIIAKNTLSLQGNGDAVINGKGNINIVAETLQLGGNGKVNFSGNPVVTIWAQQSLKMRGNSEINANGNAASLLVYANGAVDIDMKGNPDVVGVLYAPTAAVDMGGNCTWTGAVLAKTIYAHGNNKIIADESLLLPTGGAGAYVTAWVEVAPK